MKTIPIKGDVIPNDSVWFYDWFGDDYTSPRKIENALKEANGEEVEFVINSPGGDVFAGYEIYNLIKEYTGQTTSKIIGLAASAASFIATATDKTVAAALSQIMIHRASTRTSGNTNTHQHSADFLSKVDNTIVKAYSMKNGKTDDEMLELMDKETWFTADEAKELGIIDEIINDNSSKPVAYNSSNEKQEMINRLLEFGSIENIQKAIAENRLGHIDIKNVADNIPTNKKEECEMTLDKLKSEHGDLYNQIVQDATNAERERIKAINDLAMPGVEDIVSEAIENGDSAEKVAINIVKATKEKGVNYLKNAQEDAKPLDQVQNPAPAPKAQEDEKAAENMAKYANERRGR